MRHLAFENTSVTFTEQFVHKRVKRTKYTKKKKTHCKRIELICVLISLFFILSFYLSINISSLTTFNSHYRPSTVQFAYYNTTTASPSSCCEACYNSHLLYPTARWVLCILEEYHKSWIEIRDFVLSGELHLTGGSSTLQRGSNAWICSFFCKSFNVKSVTFHWF